MKYIIFLSICVLSFNGISQKVLKSPEKFITPTYFDNDVSMANFVFDKGAENREKLWWFVVADREDIKAYEKPDANSNSISTLEYLKYYYVIEESGKYLELVEGPQPKSNGKWDTPVKTKGWVSRDQVLLWQGSLKSEASNIHMKGFILNKLSNISKILEEGSKDFANVYSSPTSTKTSKQIRFYDLYFIYKIENGRMLLGKDYNLNRISIKDNIVGWVDESKVDKWYTRVAIEPNFDEQAFGERKSKKNSARIIGFRKESNAISYLKSGEIATDQVVWDNDPVLEKFEYLSTENKRRYKGSVYRFPLLNLANVANKLYYKSGTIGQVTTRTVNELGITESISKRDPLLDVKQSDNILDDARDEKDNVNLFFLIEDIPSTSPYKDIINNVIGNAKSIFNNSPNLRIGAAFYIDSPEKGNGKDFRLVPLTTDFEKVATSVTNSAYSKLSDFDDFNAINHAFYQSLIKGGFSKNGTNIFVVIGENADISFSKKRALANTSDKEYFIDSEALVKEMAKYNPHIIVAQTQSEDKKAQREFLMTNRELINEVCYEVFDNFNSGLKKYYGARYEGSNPEPEFPQVVQGEKCILKMGTSKSRLNSPSAKQPMDKGDMLSYILEGLKEVNADLSETYSDVSNIVNEGASIEDVSSGAWEPSLCRLIYTNLSKSGGNDASFKEQLKRIVDEKYRLFNEIYLPQSSTELTSPLYTFVLFMPRRDLREYIRALEDLARSGNGPVSEQRVALFETIKSMVESYSGEKIKASDVKSMSMDQVRALMQGISEQGYFIGQSISDKIGIKQLSDILDEKIITDGKFEEIIRSFTEKAKSLEKIEKLGDKYEYSYRGSQDNDSIYFWIPSEFLL
jgi:hypothetical protein